MSQHRVLDRISYCDEAQIELGHRLGLELQGRSVSVGRALIDDEIDRAFGNSDLGVSSDKQVELARRFGIDISSCSRRVAFAVIDEILTQLNLESIVQQSIVPGCRVVRTRGGYSEFCVVSSVTSDGLVYFKGGNGQKAWARNLKVVE